MTEMKSLEDFLMDELKDIYSGEDQLITTLPKMAIAATSIELKKSFDDNLKRTESRVERLNMISKLAGNRVFTGRISKAMEGLIKEGADIIEENCSNEVRDIALLASAQKIGYHEIAAYGSAKIYSRLLGYIEVEELLHISEKEETAACKKLTSLAKAITSGTKELSEIK